MLKVVAVPIAKVHPYRRNPRVNEAAVDKVAESIREFGWRQPIVVDKSMTVVAGHTRLLAALRLGLREVPVHVADELNDAQIKAYRLADNRVHEESTWNEELLKLELGDLSHLGFDLKLTGFDADELAALLTPEDGLLPSTDEDAVPPVPETPETFPGDVVQLGKHRLICGDSTDPYAIEELFAGAKADMIFTDPPYNVDYVGKTADALKIKNDHQKEAAFHEFLRRAYAVMFRQLKGGGAIYVCHADTEGLRFRSLFSSTGFKLSGCLIWCKDSMVLGRSDYQWQHEPILYGWKPTQPHKWYGSRKATTISEIMMDAPLTQVDERTWRARFGDRWFLISGEKLKVEELETTVAKVARPKRSEEHPTMKPVALIEKFLGNSSRKADLIFDPFAGSGSTLIACQKNGRTAYCAELDPRFCDVIVRRWEEATGKTAKREKRV
jgi:DNA modification methylase